MSAIEIGRLLRAGVTGFVAGCRLPQYEQVAPSLGALVRAPLGEDMQIYGLIHDIHVDDDGLVRQLVTAEQVGEATIADNRINRTVPVEISVLAVGYQEEGQIHHLLPPRPPLSLDLIHLCEEEEVRAFTGTGRFGYLRHILRTKDLPVDEILAAHIRTASIAQEAAGNSEWHNQVTREIITLLRDDYQTLMSVLGALSDTIAEAS